MALTNSKSEARSKTGSRAGSKPRPKASAKRPANQAARARTARRIATGVAAASVVGLAVAGTARAVRNNDRAIPKLPAPGATIETDIVSKGVELAFVDRKVNTGPLEGKATFEIESNNGDLSSVRTKVTEFFLTSPAHKGGVTIAVEPKQREPKRHSILRLDTSGTPKFDHTMILELRVSVQYPEVLGLPEEYAGPVTLVVRDTAELLGKFAGFPHDGARYRLKDRAVLAEQDQPGGNIGAINKFPVKIRGL